MEENRDNDRTLEGSNVRLSELDFREWLTDEDIYNAGHAVLMHIGVAVSLGHNSPNGAMEYAPRPSDPIRAAVWDSFAATRMGQLGKDAQDDLVRFAAQRGLLEMVAAAASK